MEILVSVMKETAKQYMIDILMTSVQVRKMQQGIYVYLYDKGP